MTTPAYDWHIIKNLKSSEFIQMTNITIKITTLHVSRKQAIYEKKVKDRVKKYLRLKESKIVNELVKERKIKER